MRRVQTFAVVLGVMGASLAAATPAVADDKDDKENLVERIVAKANPNLLEVLVTKRNEDGPPSFDTIHVPTVAAARRVVADMLGRQGVASVEMNQPIHVAGFNDPQFSQQWAMDSRHLDSATLYSMTRNDTFRPYVAVIDSGVQASHPDLSGRLASGYDAIGSGSQTSDGCGHGTHVAGIVAAAANNSRGIVGMSRTALIRPVKIFDSSCSGTVADSAQGITWAADRAQVLNMSYQSSVSSSAEQAAVDYARSRGRILVAAAGNHDPSCGGLLGLGCTRNSKSYPAGYSGVIGAAAVDSSSQVASFSNYGSWVDVAAPGVSIMSTVPSSSRLGCGSSSYCRLSGTSMAAPHVSALAAMAVAHCRWSASTVTDRIFRRASHYPTKNDYTGYGIIRPKAVLGCT